MNPLQPANIFSKQLQTLTKKLEESCILLNETIKDFEPHLQEDISVDELRAKSGEEVLEDHLKAAITEWNKIEGEWLDTQSQSVIQELITKKRRRIYIPEDLDLDQLNPKGDGSDEGNVYLHSVSNNSSYAERLKEIFGSIPCLEVVKKRLKKDALDHLETARLFEKMKSCKDKALKKRFDRETALFCVEEDQEAEGMSDAPPSTHHQFSNGRDREVAEVEGTSEGHGSQYTAAVTIHFSQQACRTPHQLKVVTLPLSTTLSQLRQIIDCPLDALLSAREMSRQNKGFFYIGENLYVEPESCEDAEYCKSLAAWIKSCSSFVEELAGSFTDVNVLDMRTTKLENISFRIGEYYLFCHQGNCEHQVYITDFKLLNQKDQQNNQIGAVKFPTARSHRCEICEMNAPDFLCLNDEFGHSQIMNYCKYCYHMLHYTAEGHLKHKDKFKVFPYKPIANRPLVDAVIEI